MAHILLRVQIQKVNLQFVCEHSHMVASMVALTNGSKTSGCFDRLLSVIHMHYILIYTNCKVVRVLLKNEVTLSLSLA